MDLRLEVDELGEVAIGVGCVRSGKLMEGLAGNEASGERPGTLVLALLDARDLKDLGGARC